MEIVVHSKKSISTKVVKEIVPFKQELSIYECDVKNDPTGHQESESDKKSGSGSGSQSCYDSDSATLLPTPFKLSEQTSLSVSRAYVKQLISKGAHDCAYLE